MRELGSVTFRAFDTVCAVSADVDAAALREIEALCARDELLLSRFNPESRLFALNAAAGEWVDVGNELATVLRVALGYCERTDGLFDITMGDVCRLWDFKRGVVPDDAAIAEALAHVDWRNVQVEGTQARIIDPQTTIDLGGMAKGYIADRVIDLLKHCGATSGVINLGGNVAVLGEKAKDTPWNIAIERPYSDRTEMMGYVSVKDATVVTSGIYERKFEQDGVLYHHVLDPHTGYPVDTDLEAVTIRAAKGNSGFCDGLSTVCLMLGKDKAQALIETLQEEHPEMKLEAAFIDKNDAMTQTDGMDVKKDE